MLRLEEISDCIYQVPDLLGLMTIDLANAAASILRYVKVAVVEGSSSFGDDGLPILANLLRPIAMLRCILVREEQDQVEVQKPLSTIFYLPDVSGQITEEWYEQKNPNPVFTKTY